MKRTLILIYFTVILGASVAYALDPPHNIDDPSNKVNCSNCHYTGSTGDNSICLDCHNTTNMGQTKFGLVQTHVYGPSNTEILCRTCHNPHYQRQATAYPTGGIIDSGTTTSITSSAPTSTLTDSTLNKFAGKDYTDYVLIPNTAYPSLMYRIVSNDANTITVQGTIKLGTNNLYAGPGKTYAIKYGKMIKDVVATPNSGNKQVKFFNNEGVNSFADGDATIDGICQVCHTQTQYFTNTGTLDGSGAHPAQAGANCTGCHTHNSNFTASCTSCHGNPPIVATAGGPSGLADNNGATPGGTTGSTTPGAHDAHVNSQGIGCTACHYGSTGSGGTHNNGDLKVTLGFYLFGGAVQGGAYDGQTGVSYNATSTTPATNTSSGGGLTCSTVYCHSTVQGAAGTGAPTYATPSWTNSSPNNVQCGTCHKGDGTSGNASLMDSGSHTKHVASTEYNKPCSTCHTGAGSGTSVHVNNLINVAIDSTYGGTYSGDAGDTGNHAPGQGYGKCSSVYCHSDGKSTPTYVAGVSWGGSTTCTSCHGGANGSTGGAGTTLSGNHALHTGGSYNYGCTDCHNSVASNNSTISDKTLHVNKTKNINFAASRGGGGASYNSGAGTCSTTYCHGSSSPAWSSSTANATCTKCHGNPTVPGSYALYKAAPGADGAGRDTNGDTGTVASNVSSDPQVGAHDTHLRALNGYGRPAVCSDCHAVPSAATDVGHIDTALPAELTWSSLVTNNGGLTPTYNSGTGQCSSTYCHGNAMPKGSTGGTNKSPVWTDGAYLTGTRTLSGDCSKCHASPPTTVSPHTGSETMDQCAQCHNHFNADGTLNNAALHIDGVLQAAGGCDACHGYPPVIGDGKAYIGTGLLGKGAHQKHVNHLLALTGLTLDAQNDQFTSAKVAAICGVCHDTSNANNHMNGNDNRQMLIPAAYVFGPSGSPTYNGNPATTTNKTCSNVSCHFKTSPGWQDPLTAGN